MKHLILLILSFWALDSSAQNLHDVHIISGKNNNSIFPLMSETNIDNNGNIFLYLTFVGTVDTDPSEDSTILTNLSRIDNLMLKYNSDMNLVWHQILRHKTGNYNSPFSVSSSVTNPNEDIILLGIDNGIDFDPSSTDTFYLNSGSGAPCLVSYSGHDGSFQWAKSLFQARFEKINTDNNGNMYIIGSFKDSINLSLNATSPDWHEALGQRDAFITKLDNQANTLWSIQLKGSKDVNLTQLEVVNNEIIVGGNFEYFVEVNPNDASDNLFTGFPFDQNDIFIAKYDLQGNFISAKSFGSTGEDILDVIEPLNNDNLFISGSFANTINFDSSNTAYQLTSNGTDNRFYTVISSSYLPSSATQTKGYADVYSHSVASDGSIYLSGAYFGDFEVPSNPSLNLLGLASAGRAYLLKVNTSGAIDFTQQIGFNNSSVSYANGVLIHGDIMKVVGTGKRIEYNINNQTYVEDSGNDQFIFVMDYDTYPLEVKSLVHNHQITIYPNPTEEYLYIKNPKGNPISTIKVYSMLGELLIDKVYSEQFSTTDLAAGSYIIVLDDEANSTYTAQFIKK